MGNNIIQKYQNKIPVSSGKINVYSEGQGNATIIFLSGAGVTSPVLEYKPLYSRLSDEYRIAVVEKSGYGFSESTGTERTVENMVSESRAALRKAGINPPYILAPHSYSGFEAIWWANTYPDEIKAIFSIDMGIPSMAIAMDKVITKEKKLRINEKRRKLFTTLAKQGLMSRILAKWTVNTTGLLTSDYLSDAEKEIYKKLFYQNLLNKEIEDENMLMTDNAVKAEKTGIIKVPSYFYISDMKTPVKSTTWKQEAIKYAEKAGGQYKYTDAGHMMYAKIPDEMARDFKNFLKTISINTP